MHPTEAQLAKDHRFMLNVSHGPTLKHCVSGPGGCLNLFALVFMPLFLEDAVCIFSRSHADWPCNGARTYHSKCHGLSR